jgi:8-oxo-dGTP pyrophosphatase MutT (NUDIX family)
VRSIAEVEGRILRGLSRPLPGVEAQTILAPKPRRGWAPGTIPEDARPGAVLLLVYPAGGDPRVLLTVRGARLRRHAGQVSLPGGAVDAGESTEAAALREAEEEVGVPPRTVRVLGRLTPLHVPVSGFVLVPVVGVASARPPLAPHAEEVRAVLEPSLADLCAPGSVSIERRVHRGRAYEVPFLVVDGERVWGATAMILSEFLALIGSPPRLPPYRTP